MLHIVLFVLKIIGTILLAILAIIALLICIVLYSPLKYHAEAKIDQIDSDYKKQSENSDEKEKKHIMNMFVKFSWFFRCVSGYIRYAGEGLEWQFSIFGKKIDAKFLKEREAVKTSTKLPEEITEEVSNEITKEEKKDDGNLENNIEIQNDEKSNKKDTVDSELEIEEACETKEKAFDKIKDFRQRICEKIKNLNERKELVENFINNEIHKSAFVQLKKELFRFLRRLKPKKFYLKLHFGFEDPSVTGKLLGALCMLYPVFQDDIDIQPEFQSEILEGETLIIGKLKCSYPISMGLRLIWNRDVRRTIKDLLSEIKK